MDDAAHEQTSNTLTSAPEVLNPQATPVVEAPVDPYTHDNKIVADLYKEACNSVMEKNEIVQMVTLRDPDEDSLTEERDENLLSMLEKSLVRGRALNVGITGPNVHLTSRKECIATDTQELMHAVVLKADLQDSAREKGLQEDLGMVDINPFYEQFLSASVLLGKEGNAGMVYLKAALAVKLNAAAEARGEKKDRYSNVEVERIFDALIDDRRVTEFMNILYQQRLLIALSIDMELGSHFTELIDVIIAGDHTPSEKLSMIDSVLGSISKARLLNTNSAENVRSLCRLNQTQDDRKRDTQLRSLERGFEEDTIPLQIARAAATIAEKYPAMPGADRELFLEAVRLGDGEMVMLMLESGVKKSADGSYVGCISKEPVHIARKDGKCCTYLVCKDTSTILMKHTQPNAMGFDMALGEKKMRENGCWKDLKDRPDILIAFVEENPTNETFVSEHQARDFADILGEILPNNGEPAMNQLKKLGVVYASGLLHQRYVDSLKLTLRHWAPEGDLSHLKGMLGPRTLEALVSLWQKKDSTLEPGLSDFSHMRKVSSPLPHLELSDVLAREKILPKAKVA
jgi:hypothetical protein